MTNSLGHIKRHVTSHVRQKPFKCLYCNVNAEKREDIFNHMHAVHLHRKFEDTPLDSKPFEEEEEVEVKPDINSIKIEKM